MLPLLLGSATRLAKFYGQSEKVYEFRARFGFATDTYDSEGTPFAPPTEVHLDAAEVERALTPFRGQIQQTPPPFSAKKVGGVPAYKLAREKKVVQLAPISIEVFALDLLDLKGDEASFRMHCSTGAYVRSLVHDLGIALGCGAHLTALRRTRSGDFEIARSYTIPALEQLRDSNRLDEAILPAAQLLPDFASVVTDATTAAQIRNGRDFHTSPFVVRAGTKFVKALTESGSLLAIAEAVLPNLYHPIVVLA